MQACLTGWIIGQPGCLSAAPQTSIIETLNSVQYEIGN